MLLQQIIDQLDAELDRLVTLRHIVAALHRPPTHITASDPQSELASDRPDTTGEPETNSISQPRTRTRRLQYAKVLKRAPQASNPVTARLQQPPALASVLPTGPVVVSPAALARERALRKAAPSANELVDTESAVGPETDPEALARSLASRWRMGPLTGAA